MATVAQLTQKLESMEKQLQVLQDKEAIRDVLSRYAFNVDLNRLDHYTRLFTDDLLFVTDGPGEDIHKHTKQELKDFLIEVLPKPYPGMQHLQLDYVIEVDGDRAIARGYQLLTLHKDGQFGIIRCALRTFKFLRVEGVWKITSTISHATCDEPDCQKQIPQSW